MELKVFNPVKFMQNARVARIFNAALPIRRHCNGCVAGRILSKRNLVSPITTIDCVSQTLGAKDHIIAVTGINQVIAGIRGDRIVADARIDCIGLTIKTINGFSAIAAIEHVTGCGPFISYDRFDIGEISRGQILIGVTIKVINVVLVVIDSVVALAHRFRKCRVTEC